MQGLSSIYRFFATSLINSIIQEHEFFLSNDIKIILKSFFRRKTFGFCHVCDVKNVNNITRTFCFWHADGM